MKKILSLLTAIIIFAASPSYAFEKAVPMDFIFKGGDFREHMIMVIDAPLSARIAGPDGSHFYIDFAGRCELQNTETDDNGIETYSAAPNTVTVRSSAEKTGNGSLAAGLIYEPVTSSLAWLVHSTGPAGTGRCTKDLPGPTRERRRGPRSTSGVRPRPGGARSDRRPFRIRSWADA